MKIGNKSIKGLYRYKNGVTFELNDIIYYEGMLYTVVASTYNGDVTPDESPRCESFIEKLINSNDIITSNNVLRVVNNIIDGLQLGGAISRVTIDTISDLDAYNKNGVYSLCCSLFSDHSFESLLRVYRFEVDDTIKVLQEITEYSDLRNDVELDPSEEGPYPTTIWYRVGIVNGNNITWGNFSSVVSAHNNDEYELALKNLLNADKLIKDNLSEIAQKLNNGSHYLVNKKNNQYKINRNRTGLINVIFNYKQGSYYYQDNMTYDLSVGTGRAKSVSGNNYLITVSTSGDDWVISFPSGITILKVIELNV